MASAHRAPIMSKWSLNTKTRNPTRVRDNQRRHRARVKAHIDSLEKELSQSRQELREARDRIHELEVSLAARESAQATIGRPHNSSPEPRLLGNTANEQRCCNSHSRSINHACEQHHHRSPTKLLISPMSTEDPTAPSLVFADPLHDHEGRFPLVAHGESTTLCRVAYEIIAQQKTTDIDDSDVEQWLWPGFRQAVKQGEGCRVNTKVLYALIDHISPL